MTWLYEENIWRTAKNFNYEKSRNVQMCSYKQLDFYSKIDLLGTKIITSALKNYNRYCKNQFLLKSFQVFFIFLYIFAICTQLMAAVNFLHRHPSFCERLVKDFRFRYQLRHQIICSRFMLTVNSHSIFWWVLQKHLYSILEQKTNQK